MFNPSFLQSAPSAFTANDQSTASHYNENKTQWENEYQQIFAFHNIKSVNILLQDYDEIEQDALRDETKGRGDEDII